MWHMSNTPDLLTELKLDEPGTYAFDEMAVLIGSLLRHAAREAEAYSRSGRSFTGLLATFEDDPDHLAAAYRADDNLSASTLAVAASRVSISLCFSTDPHELYGVSHMYKAELWARGLAQWHSQDIRLVPTPWGSIVPCGVENHDHLSEDKCRLMRQQVQGFIDAGEMILDKM